MKSIDQKDYELIKDLYHWKININEFKRKTEFKANFKELKYLLYSVKYCKDKKDTINFSIPFYGNYLKD